MGQGFYNIGGFMGINQSMNQNYIREGESPDARNFDTTDGDLMVAAGYVKHFKTPVPGDSLIRRHYVWRGLSWTRHNVIAGNEVYALTDKVDGVETWSKIYTYTVDAEKDTNFGLRWDILETRIGATDYVIIANGERQMIKWDGKKDTAELFGSAAKVSDKKVNFVEMHYSRLFSAGDRDFPSRLYWSVDPNYKTNTIEDWTKAEPASSVSGGFIEVGDVGSDPITGLCAISNQLLIFKRNSIYRLLGTNPDNFMVYRVYSEVETMTNSGLAIYGDTPFWMTKEGIYYHDGQSSMPLFNARNIHKFLANARLTMCKAAEHKGKLYFTCRTGDVNAPQDDAIIVYNVRDRTYMIRDGFEVADICAAGQLFMINHNRIVYRFEEGDSYDGEPIHAYWNTPVTDLGQKSVIKTLEEFYLRAEGVGAAEDKEGAVILVHAFADQFSLYKRYLVPADPKKVLEIPLKNQGRTFSLRILNEAGSRWKISGGVQLRYAHQGRTI